MIANVTNWKQFLDAPGIAAWTDTPDRPFAANAPTFYRSDFTVPKNGDTHETIGLPSSYVVNIGDSHVVMAQASSVTNLAQSPRAQLTMIHLAELATGRRKLDLPKNSEHSEEHL